MPSNKYISLKQSDIIPLREKLHKEQNMICPLLKIEVPFDKVVLDHKHKLKDVEASEENGGLVRGAIEFRANALEGKISNSFKRLFGSDESQHPISLPNYLRNLADFLENPPCEQIYIHPNETKELRTKASKQDYNRIKKYWKNLYPHKKIFPFPKSGWMTEEMKKVLPEFNEFDRKVKEKIYKKCKKSEVDFIAKNYKKLYKNRNKCHLFLSYDMYKTEEVKKLLSELYPFVKRLDDV